MNNEQTFTVVGTSKCPDGTYKARWTNDMSWRITTLIKRDNDDIKLYELPKPMIKLDAIKWLNENKDILLTPAEREIIEYKIFEKSKRVKKLSISKKQINNIKNNLKENAPLKNKFQDPMLLNK